MQGHLKTIHHCFESFLGKMVALFRALRLCILFGSFGTRVPASRSRLVGCEAPKIDVQAADQQFFGMPKYPDALNVPWRR